MKPRDLASAASSQALPSRRERPRHGTGRLREARLIARSRSLTAPLCGRRAAGVAGRRTRTGGPSSSGPSRTSRSTSSRARWSASSAATAPASHPAEGPQPDHRADRGRDRAPRPGRQPAGGRHRLPPGADRPREHLPQRRHPRHDPPGDAAEVRRDRRVRRGRASSSTRRSSATPAACTCGWRSPWRRTWSRRS